MYLSHLTTLALAALAWAHPSGTERRDSNPGCQAKSMGNFAWKVEQFEYRASYVFSTPSHQNSWGSVGFVLSNPALRYKGSCSASSSQLNDFFYGTTQYSCTFPESSTTSGQFSFSRPSGLLNITQGWQCSDEDPNYPVTLNAQGSVTIELKCNDKTWQNPHWEEGETYSDREVECVPVDITVKPDQMTAVA